MKDAKFWFVANPLAGKSWSMVLLQGILFLVLGVLYLSHPAQAVMALTFLVGALLIFYGIERLVAMKGANPGGWALFMTILAILIGLFCFLSPLLATIELVIFIGIWMIFTGMDQSITAFQAAPGAVGRGLMMLNGVISLILGVLVLCFPLFGTVVIGYMIGFYLLLFGVIATVGAFAMKKALNHTNP